MHQTALFIRLGVATLTLTLLCVLPLTVAAQEPRTPAQGAPALSEPRRVEGPPPVPESGYEPQGLVPEPDLIQRAVIFADRHFGNGDLTNGFYVDSFNMIPGAGWISAGPGYRRWFSDDRLFADASAAISWRGYKTAQARVELPRLASSRLALGSQVRWQDYGHVKFFGEGAGSLESNLSEYQLSSMNVVGYATVRPAEWLDVTLQVGHLGVSSPDDRSFLHTEGSVTADSRDFPGHPTRGGVYRAAVSRFSDRDAGVFSFNRYEAEAARFIPVAGSRVVFALHGWLAASDPGDGQAVPFYLQPSLGGHNSLRGYADYRFHDRNMLLVNAEARIALMTHVDAAVFWDAGNVAPRVGDLNLDKRSWGTGVRLHSRRQTYARFDIARGDEGWRFIFRLTDPLHLSRLMRRTAPAPFVP